MVETPYPHEIVGPLIMLCEGQSDNNFFEKLSRTYNLPRFNFPFPPRHMAADGKHDGLALYSRDGFVNMLAVLNSTFKLKPDIKDSIAGILIVVDAAEDSQKSFEHVQGQIKEAGEFGVPDKIMEPKKSANRPPVAVMVVGNDKGQGGLFVFVFFWNRLIGSRNYRGVK